jgi:hypothetical protein
MGIVGVAHAANKITLSIISDNLSIDFDVTRFGQSHDSLLTVNYPTCMLTTS